ncbi:hypothetical protein [Flavobacterium subsaxonicum]|uniref:Lipoprotein n=1 Tax=Flavobacterium subsaxonicum WB 4.1-42 = DSM 21790 TaxID=1121898 RepID=A0A0A2MLB9_9FLAO|nr:hypothetical protein [Flavobacterium subsaxonicum]KGO93457.1 hypothetical protein Q766_09190 [Flavobacterium subsaxonicum WB 4.1-42 = DSM 21790]
MKKLILSIALLAGLTFVACEDDNEEIIVAYVGCQICEIPDSPAGAAPSTVEEVDYEVCVDAEGYAYVDNQKTPLDAARYFSLFCAKAYVAPGETPEPGTTPGEGGGVTTTCVDCSSYTVQGVTVPAAEICKGENGNAYLMGVDTGMGYDMYITAYEMTGSDCQ